MRHRWSLQYDLPIECEDTKFNRSPLGHCLHLLLGDELHLSSYNRRDREMVARHYWFSLDAAEQLPFRRFSKAVTRRTWSSPLGRLWLPRHLRHSCPPAPGAGAYINFLYRLRGANGTRFLTVPLGEPRARFALELLLVTPDHGLWSGAEELEAKNLYRARRAEASIHHGGPLLIDEDRVYPLNPETGLEAPDALDPVLQEWTARQARR